MASEKVPDLVSEDSTDEILELSKSLVLRKMVDPVRTTLDLFEKNISRLVFLNPEIPHVEFRLETVKILLESLSRELKPTVYRKIMWDIGNHVGKSLGHDMIDFLMRNNKLPKTDSVMTKLWNEWDMVAGWGKIRTLHENKRIILTIEDSWIARCSGDEEHKHCSFMEGYIHGFLWVAFKERYRWFKRSVTQHSYPPLEPVEVTENAQGNRCQFIVKLREEELQDAFDALSDVGEYLRQENFGQAANSIRISLELALKNKIGIDKNDRTSVVKIMKALKKRNVQMSYKTIDEIYNFTSRIMHGAKKSDMADCRDILLRWDDVLEEIELMNLPERDMIMKDIQSS